MKKISLKLARRILYTILALAGITLLAKPVVGDLNWAWTKSELGDSMEVCNDNGCATYTKMGSRPPLVEDHCPFNDLECFGRMNTDADPITSQENGFSVRISETKERFVSNLKLLDPVLFKIDPLDENSFRITFSEIDSSSFASISEVWKNVLGKMMLDSENSAPSSLKDLQNLAGFLKNIEVILDLREEGVVKVSYKLFRAKDPLSNRPVSD